MVQLREHIAFRYLWLFLAVLIFNCSVDTPDPQPDGLPEDLNVNDMESVVEVVLETFMGIDNAIPEHDEPDNQPSGFAWKLVIDPSFIPGTCIATYWNATAEKRVGAPASEELEGRHRPEPSAPPPKA